MKVNHLIRLAIVLDLSAYLNFLCRIDDMIYMSSFWACFMSLYDAFIRNGLLGFGFGIEVGLIDSLLFYGTFL